MDESDFGDVRKGKRGRGAAGKTPIFGLLKRGGKVIPDARQRMLMIIIEEKTVPDSIVYSDSYTVYDTLDASSFKHFRINHSRKFVDGRNHINYMENFWSQAKRHMCKFNGISKEHFPLFLKECEWRFNNSGFTAQFALL